MSGKGLRAPESLARASYTISAHLSRTLSPLLGIVTSSVLVVRVIFLGAAAAGGGTEAEFDRTGVGRGDRPAEGELLAEPFSLLTPAARVLGATFG